MGTLSPTKKAVHWLHVTSKPWYTNLEVGCERQRPPCQRFQNGCTCNEPRQQAPRSPDNSSHMCTTMQTSEHFPLGIRTYVYPWLLGTTRLLILIRGMERRPAVISLKPEARGCRTRVGLEPSVGSRRKKQRKGANQRTKHECIVKIRKAHSNLMS
jgi:hypothetical protein